MSQRDQDGIECFNITNRLVHCLSSCQAMNVDAILHRAGTGRDTVLEALRRLVDRREVEVLRPVALSECSSDNGPTLHPLEHYRLVRPTDRDYIWEKKIPASDVLPGPAVHSRRVTVHPEIAATLPDAGWFWFGRRQVYGAV